MIIIKIPLWIVVGVVVDPKYPNRKHSDCYSQSLDKAYLVAFQKIITYSFIVKHKCIVPVHTIKHHNRNRPSHFTYCSFQLFSIVSHGPHVNFLFCGKLS